jgi:hypothetical protein
VRAGTCWDILLFYILYIYYIYTFWFVLGYIPILYFIYIPLIRVGIYSYFIFGIHYIYIPFVSFNISNVQYIYVDMYTHYLFIINPYLYTVYRSIVYTIGYTFVYVHIYTYEFTYVYLYKPISYTSDTSINNRRYNSFISTHLHYR